MREIEITLLANTDSNNKMVKQMRNTGPTKYFKTSTFKKKTLIHKLQCYPPAEKDTHPIR